MMISNWNSTRLVIPTAIALLGLAHPGLAGPVWTPAFFASDQEFNEAYTGSPTGNGTLEESFGVEGRWGNNRSDTGIYEYNINRLTSPTTFQFGAITGGYVWSNGTPTPFELVYAGDNTKQIEWKVGTASVLSLNALFGDVKELMVRTRSTTSSTSLLINNLRLIDLATNTTFIAPMDATSQISGPGVDFLAISNFDFTRAWKLSGDVTLSWNDASPPSSQTAMNFQVKGMKLAVAPVPEPATLAMTGAGLLGALAIAHQRGRRACSMTHS